MTLNFKKMCRICMNDSSAVLPIYEKVGLRGMPMMELLNKLTSITIHPNDGLPANVCLSCLGEINNILAFKEKCERSDETLRAYLKASLKEKPSNIVHNKEYTIEIVDCDALEDDDVTVSETEDTETEKIIVNNLPDLPLQRMPHDTADNIKDTVHPVSAVSRYVRPKTVFVTLPQAEHKCRNCGAGFVELKSLNFHEKSEMCMKFRFTCEECDRVFDEEKLLLSHKKEVHEDAKNKCDICSKQFESNTQLYYHIQYHKQSKKHQCSQCNKGFNMLSTLKDHLRTHSGEKPFLCSICGRGFSQSTNLKQHMMRHNKTKPYKCSTCNCSFVSKGELTAHIRKHTGDHPFVCDTCGTGFTTSSSMVKHKRIHSGVKKYACEFCPLRFTALATLKNHRRTHTGERPFGCKFCPRSFAQKSDLVAHTRTHTGERPYICDECGMSFLQKGSLKLHQKKIHEDSGFTTASSSSKSFLAQ